tara:strand:+ start:1244 stop:2107 length:864 start_codon:yes stop_codon:yes gene_type:complete
MARYATGRRALAISDRSGFRLKYKDLRTEWNQLRVEPEEYEPKQPQLNPRKNVIDAIALFQPRPDNDPTNILINLQYNWFDNNQSHADTKQTLDSTQFRKPLFPTGHSAIGSVFIDFSQEVFATGVSAIASVRPNRPPEEAAKNAIGVKGEGEIGILPGFTTEQVVTGLAGTGTIGTYGESDGPNLSITETGVNATGAIGSAVTNLDHNRWGIGPWGQGAWGISNPAPDVDVSGVNATGAIGTEQVFLGHTINATGVEGEGEIGTASVTIATTSWGDESWGDDTWGQ